MLFTLKHHVFKSEDKCEWIEFNCNRQGCKRFIGLEGLVPTYLAQRLNSHSFAAAALVELPQFARRLFALFLKKILKPIQSELYAIRLHQM